MYDKINKIILIGNKYFYKDFIFNLKIFFILKRKSQISLNLNINSDKRSHLLSYREMKK